MEQFFVGSQSYFASQCVCDAPIGGAIPRQFPLHTSRGEREWYHSSFLLGGENSSRGGGSVLANRLRSFVLKQVKKKHIYAVSHPEKKTCEKKKNMWIVPGTYAYLKVNILIVDLNVNMYVYISHITEIWEVYCVHPTTPIYLRFAVCQ